MHIKNQFLVLTGLFISALSLNSFGGGMVYSRYQVRETSASHRAIAKVSYFGGPVISHAKVYTVFWGPNVDPQVSTKIGAFYKTIVDSSYMDWMKEYNTNVQTADGKPGSNQKIGRGTYVGEVTITPQNINVTLDKKDVEAELVYQVSQGKLPAPDADTLYMIHFPLGITLMSGGEASCQAWCADHEGFQNAKYGNFYYAMMPDISACMFGCGFAPTLFDSVSVAASHELAESVTDPLCPDIGASPGYPAAWIDGGEEIGDKCTGNSSDLATSNGGTVSVQAEWSNDQNTCYNGPFSSP